jgi:hypothetical protein
VTTTNILEGIAVARRTADEAATIFGAYATTKGLQMAQAHTATPEQTPTPSSGAPTPGGMGGGGGGGSTAPQAAASTGPSPVVAEHEIFKNEKNALAFFFYHSPLLDKNAEEGPFWFTIQNNNKIIAGTSKAYAAFEDIKPEIIATAKQRGVIMLVEFENQQPFRCTPCYLSDSF